MIYRHWPSRVFLLLLLTSTAILQADGPADNKATQVRPVPPVGIAVPENVKTELLNKSKSIRDALSKLKLDAVSKSHIEVIPRAVEMTVEHGMFYIDKEFAQADELLALAQQRLQAAGEGKRSAELLEVTLQQSSDKPKLLSGGYRSRLDGSIQPYGLVVPAGWKADPSKPVRLDVWLHGRGEKVSEVAFMHQRMHQVGEFAPPNTLVLHPYGRYCNAFKFAGEIDVLEAIENVKQIYPIDNTRIAIRGFSMGGAGCWQLAVHYPQLWAAANPGAGFSETMEFLRVFQKEDFKPTDYQRKLLHWYDCPDWTNNLRNLLTVAYSGEVDNQKQAADVMEAAYKLRGMKLPHVIGPQTAHKILDTSKPIIQKQLDDALDIGRSAIPKTIDLTTFTLRYHELAWLSIEGLDKHWEEAIIHAELGKQEVLLQSKNIVRMKLQFSEQDFPFTIDKPIRLKVDSQPLTVAFHNVGQSKVLWLIKDPDGTWKASANSAVSQESLVKRPGLCGPIDDAFMDAFVWVPPSQTDTSNGSWYDTEFQHATKEWRRHFRGDIVVKSELTDADIANNNLILFGTPTSNPLIAKVLTALPIEWTTENLRVAGVDYDAQTHAPLLIYPNPLNPNRYVVINSGFTFREFAYLNNARQIPMLPDWAVVDVSQGANSVSPGNVVNAGFFDEHWGF
jgi:pimeloyl-ACP methyl ester carboxylesterase